MNSPLGSAYKNPKYILKLHILILKNLWKVYEILFDLSIFLGSVSEGPKKYILIQRKIQYLFPQMTQKPLFTYCPVAILYITKTNSEG